MIKSLKTTKDGFYAYSKIISEEKINELINIVDRKIEESRDNILNCNFNINPKKIGDKLVGCEYCKYKDLCFMKEEDIIELEEKEFLE